MLPVALFTSVSAAQVASAGPGSGWSSRPTPVCLQAAPLSVSGPGLLPDAPHTLRQQRLRSDLDQCRAFDVMAVLSGRPGNASRSRGASTPAVTCVSPVLWLAGSLWTWRC